MKSFAVIFVAILMSSSAAQAGAYEDLVAKAQAGDADVDFTALRTSYTQTQNYDPYSAGSVALTREAFQAANAKDCKTALEKADAALKLDFTNADLHMLRSNCLDQAGEKSQAMLELSLGRGLFNSIKASGDGKTPDTAYVVVTLREEGLLLAVLLDARETAQALLSTSKGPVDELTATNLKTGTVTKVYFNVNALFQGEMRQLQGKEQSPKGP
jgi:hypothetical protein